MRIVRPLIILVTTAWRDIHQLYNVQMNAGSKKINFVWKEESSHKNLNQKRVIVWESSVAKNISNKNPTCSAEGHGHAEEITDLQYREALDRRAKQEIFINDPPKLTDIKRLMQLHLLNGLALTAHPTLISIGSRSIIPFVKVEMTACH